MKQMIKIMTVFIFLTTITFAHPGQIVKAFKLMNSFSTGLTFDGANLWYTDYKADKIFCVDASNGKIIKEIPSPGFWPMGLAWDGANLWNVDKKQKKIFKLDPSTGRILFSFDAPSVNPEGLTWDGNTLWLSDPSSDKIMKLDLDDGTAVKSFTAPASYSQGLTFDGNYIWCSDRIMDEIYMIDPSNGEVILVINSPGKYTRGLAFDGAYLWNIDYQSDSLYQIVRKDEEKFSLSEPRRSIVTSSHEVKAFGDGNINKLNVYFAIPETLLQQKILDVKYSPGKFDFVTDDWDQKYAFFHYENIPAGKITSTQMIVKTELSKIDYYIFPDECGTIADIPANIKNLYTRDGSKYQLTDPYIQNLSKEIIGLETNPYWMARKIFDFVRNKLEYKLEGGWNTAPVVLDRGTGSCSEYTFSFIALCRAAGIPARYVGSIVVRGDDASLDDVFHRWPEVYLPNYGWIPIDPQGGDKPSSRDRAMHIGHLSNRFLITTHNGGNSKYLGWYYNSFETYETDPKIKVEVETFSEWEPEGK